MIAFIDAACWWVGAFVLGAGALNALLAAAEWAFRRACKWVGVADLLYAFIFDHVARKKTAERMLERKRSLEELEKEGANDAA